MINRPCRRPGFWALLILPAVAAFGAITMLLWNWLIPAIFGGPVVTFWQALGLLLLAKILVGTGHGRHVHHRPPESWRNHLRDHIEHEHHHHPDEPAEPGGVSPEAVQAE